MSIAALAPKLRHLLWLGLKFGLVGVGSVLVYFGVLVALRPVIAGTVPLTATSYAASAAFNYALQSTFTFRARAIDARVASRYLVMHGTCMAVNSFLMFVLVDLHGNGVVRAQMAVTLAVAGLSFILSYLWVYMTPAAPVGSRREGGGAFSRAPARRPAPRRR